MKSGKNILESLKMKGVKLYKKLKLKKAITVKLKSRKKKKPTRITEWPLSVTFRILTFDFKREFRILWYLTHNHLKIEPTVLRQKRAMVRNLAKTSLHILQLLIALYGLKGQMSCNIYLNKVLGIFIR